VQGKLVQKAQPTTESKTSPSLSPVSKSIKPPAFSPRKEIRFGALINQAKAKKIKQETRELIEGQLAE